MQCGEGTSEGQDWILKAKILEVVFDSGIKAAHANAAIDPPHWEEGKDYYGSEDFSSRAAVILCKDAKTSDETKPVKLKVEVLESECIEGDAVLTGVLDSLEIEGSLPTSVGTHDVEAEIKELPEGIFRANGPAEWVARVEGKKGQASLGTTKVEVFATLDQPLFVFASTPGVWTEALRLLCTKAGVLGYNDASEAMATIASYFHGSHGLEYDHLSGGTKYVNFGADTFALDAYMEKARGTRVNCHDQAAAIHLFGAALGIEAERRYLSPFGFITATSLVGSAPCNNPFHESPRYPHTKDELLVDPSSPHYIERSSFGNHGFVQLKKAVFDACAGPGGGDKRKAYLRAAIDRETHRLRKKKGLDKTEWGRAGDITSRPNISSVS